MFIREKDYNNCVQKVRIDVGTLVGLEKDDEAYIVLKELPTKEIMNLRESYTKGELATMEFFEGILPSIMVDHNFYETENKKMTTKDVTVIIFERIELSTKVLNEYSNANFFTHQKKSDNK